MDNGHSTNLLTELDQARKDELLCDVNIHVEDQVFPAHRIVLAASSDYFKTMFTTNMKEKCSGSVTINNISAEAVKGVLDFIYTGNIELTTENVNDITKTASLLLVESLLDRVSNFYLEALNPTTALQLKDISELFSLAKLKQRVEEYILDNFVTISKQDKFLESSAEAMMYYFDQEKINASEEHLVQCLLEWTKADLTQRRNDFDTLFPLMRLEHVSIDYLLDTLRHDALIKANCERLNAIFEAVHFHTNPHNLPKQARRTNENFQIYLLNQKAGLQQIFFNNETVLQEVDNKNANACRECAVVVHQGKVFLCGGAKGGYGPSGISQIISFDGTKWKDEGNLVCARTNATAVSAQGFVYIFGGEFSRNAVTTIEKFRNGLCESDPTKELNGTRICSSSVVVGDDVYLIGGYTDSTKHGEVCQTTLKFNLQTGESSVSCSLNKGRAEFGACVVGNRIYVFGGITTSTSYDINRKVVNRENVSTIEYLDITDIGESQQQAWTCVQHQSICIGSTSAIWFGGNEIVVLGGETHELHCFDCKKMCWKKHLDYGENDEKLSRICKLGTATAGSKLIKLTR